MVGALDVRLKSHALRKDLERFCAIETPPLCATPWLGVTALLRGVVSLPLLPFSLQSLVREALFVQFPGLLQRKFFICNITFFFCIYKRN